MNKSKITMSKVGRLLILIALFSLLFIPMTALADLPPRPIPATTSTSGDDKDDDKDVSEEVLRHFVLRVRYQLL